MQQVCSYIEGRRVLITGAGGSIGSELCRQVSRYRPKEIVLFGRGENSIFAIANELTEKAPGIRRHEVIGDVINRRKLEGVFQEYRPEIVFHAGADKHVPLMETNPDEAVLNNIVGTRNVVEVADEMETQLLVAISTDKAVRPSSVMGCCKRVAEMIVQSRQRRHVTAVAVRFGNVLGSRGSVIPFFREQIEKGGPVTVTHPAMERYFMTVPEAVALVLQAGALGKGGEVFVLDMGEPVRILDLAREMIRLAGLEPGHDIPIVFSGLRPGEKLHEELIGPGQSVVKTVHPKILALRSESVDAEWLDTKVTELRKAAVEMNADAIVSLLGETVKEYCPLRPDTGAPSKSLGGPVIGIPPSSRTH
jgi:FlaA1/EpsC-like NDP-sugar epimerase